jgi:hypothetical protein
MPLQDIKIKLKTKVSQKIFLFTPLILSTAGLIFTYNFMLIRII